MCQVDTQAPSQSVNQMFCNLSTIGPQSLDAVLSAFSNRSATHQNTLQSLDAAHLDFNLEHQQLSFMIATGNLPALYTIYALVHFIRRRGGEIA